jgi:Ca2+-dependent lipid-binding protein
MSGEQQPRHLHIKLVRGRGLAAKDIGGTSDPYVKIVHRTASGDVSEWKSKVVDKTLDPVWNEELEITLPEDRSGFYLQCYEYVTNRFVKSNISVRIKFSKTKRLASVA